MQAVNPLFQFMTTIPWYAWIAIIAILSGCVTSLVSNLQRHRERMEMIRHGIHPDQSPSPEVDAIQKTTHAEL